VSPWLYGLPVALSDRMKVSVNLIFMAVPVPLLAKFLAKQRET
jgi:hypothetical protein